MDSEDTIFMELALRGNVLGSAGDPFCPDSATERQ